MSAVKGNPLTRAEVEAWSTLGPMNIDKARVLALFDLITHMTDELETLQKTNDDLIERHEAMRLRAEKAEREVADLRARFLEPITPELYRSLRCVPLLAQEVTTALAAGVSKEKMDAFLQRVLVTVGERDALRAANAASPREVSLEEQRTWELMRDIFAAGFHVRPEEFAATIRSVRTLVVVFDEAYRAASVRSTEDELELELLRDAGDLFTLEAFRERVADGSFIDDDGFGEYATATHSSHLQVDLSDITPPDARFTHVVWFNK